MKIRVEYLDGVIRTHEAVSAMAREDHTLVLRKSEYYGQTPKLTTIIPLTNVRDVQVDE